jgi:hypothetical protein
MQCAAVTTTLSEKYTPVQNPLPFLPNGNRVTTYSEPVTSRPFTIPVATGIEIPNKRRIEINPEDSDAQAGILLRPRKRLIPKVYPIE